MTMVKFCIIIKNNFYPWIPTGWMEVKNENLFLIYYHQKLQMNTAKYLKSKGIETQNYSLGRQITGDALFAMVENIELYRIITEDNFGIYYTIEVAMKHYKKGNIITYVPSLYMYQLFSNINEYKAHVQRMGVHDISQYLYKPTHRHSPASSARVYTPPRETRYQAEAP